MRSEAPEQCVTPIPASRRERSAASLAVPCRRSAHPWPGAHARISPPVCVSALAAAAPGV
eukprot:4481083-Prymnesium_polylepis.1